MKWFWQCRRTFIAVLSIGCCTALGFLNHMDVTNAIAAIAVGLAAANAGQAAYTKKETTNVANIP